MLLTIPNMNFCQLSKNRNPEINILSCSVSI